MPTVKIKQLTHYAGPLGTHTPESVWDAPIAEATALIEGGYAVQVEAVIENGAADRDIETADSAGASENAAADRKAETADAPKGFVKGKR